MSGCVTVTRLVNNVTHRQPATRSRRPQSLPATRRRRSGLSCGSRTPAAAWTRGPRVHRRQPRYRLRWIDAARSRRDRLVSSFGPQARPGTARVPTGRGALPQYVPAHLAIGVLRLPVGRRRGGADRTPLPLGMPQGHAVSRRAGVRRLPRQARGLAGRVAGLLSRQPRHQRGDRRDERDTPTDRHVAHAGRPLHRAELLSAEQTDRGRAYLQRASP